MDARHHCKLFVVILGFMLFTGSGPAISQQPPTARKGLSSKSLVEIDLGPEIESMQGRLLRMHALTIEPGGGLPLHSHKDRPAVIYVLQGRLIEYRAGEAKEYGPGDAISIGKDTPHAWENRGSVPAVYLEVDVFKQQ